jgi:integrase
MPSDFFFRPIEKISQQKSLTANNLSKRVIISANTLLLHHDYGQNASFCPMLARTARKPLIRHGPQNPHMRQNDGRAQTPHRAGSGQADRRRQRRRHEARDRCLVLLLFRHGLRVSEACGMKLSQVDSESRVLHVARLKQGCPPRTPCGRMNCGSSRRGSKSGRP